MDSRMELLTTLGSAPSLSITWVSCVAPMLKLETAEATAPSTLCFPTKTVLGHFDQITECKHSFAFCIFPLASLFRRLGSAISGTWAQTVLQPHASVVTGFLGRGGLALHSWQWPCWRSTRNPVLWDSGCDGGDLSVLIKWNNVANTTFLIASRSGMLLRIASRYLYWRYLAIFWVSLPLPLPPRPFSCDFLMRAVPSSCVHGWYTLPFQWGCPHMAASQQRSCRPCCHRLSGSRCSAVLSVHF